MRSYKDLEKTLTGKHIKPTAMRLLVLEELLGQKAAISLSDLQKRMAPVDRVTVYRTLKTFEEKGLVHTIKDGSGVPKFSLCEEACDHEHHQDAHVHFVCSACGRTLCLPDSHIPSLLIPSAFKLESVSVVARGICPDCRAAGEMV